MFWTRVNYESYLWEQSISKNFFQRYTQPHHEPLLTNEILRLQYFNILKINIGHLLAQNLKIRIFEKLTSRTNLGELEGYRWKKSFGTSFVENGCLEKKITINWKFIVYFFCLHLLFHLHDHESQLRRNPSRVKRITVSTSTGSPSTSRSFNRRACQTGHSLDQDWLHFRVPPHNLIRHKNVVSWLFDGL